MKRRGFFSTLLAPFYGKSKPFLDDEEVLRRLRALYLKQTEGCWYPGKGIYARPPKWDWSKF